MSRGRVFDDVMWISISFEDLLWNCREWWRANKISLTLLSYLESLQPRENVSCYIVVLSCFELFSPSRNVFMNRITGPPKNTLTYTALQDDRCLLSTQSTNAPSRRMSTYAALYSTSRFTSPASSRFTYSSPSTRRSGTRSTSINSRMTTWKTSTRSELSSESCDAAQSLVPHSAHRAHKLHGDWFHLHINTGYNI